MKLLIILYMFCFACDNTTNENNNSEFVEIDNTQYNEEKTVLN